jgi:hypothetical protein
MTLINNLCRRFCSYYKPTKNEEISCRGFSVVERMMREGKEISFDRSDEPVGRDTADSLSRLLCRRCLFFQEDCDFAARVGTVPCGGYLLIGKLIDGGVLSLDDLDEMD